ncbi:barstar family protein [Hamadaea tsunoensis]|uniref:barstar family protein n=1 Tax=Hamadaea tsunoensis TaxID=53368 RepID=UPI00040BA989|nr:barstar family protein [Hamadaea tsunoensis]
MAAFDPEKDDGSDPAFRLMSNTFVTLFWRPELLDQTTARLSEAGYQVTRMDAAGWATEHDLHREIAQALDFPDYYGRNLDALNDWMRDVVAGDYGWAAADTTGLALVFTRYDKFTRHCPRAAQIVLDIMADQARRALLFGRRMMCLVQSDDPQIRFEPVGAMPVMWNDAEWLDARRRP